jgi:hypothetical protein
MQESVQPSGGKPAYPLKVSDNKRYLVDQRGTPTMIFGDTAWSIIVALTMDEAEQYLENRARKGFNTILVNLIEHHYRGPNNHRGDGPFTTPGDFSTPNEAYFAHADWVIARAAAHGIQVLLTPLYPGYDHPGNSEGWIAEAMENGPEKCGEYGRYVGRRYAGHDNIIWVSGGDRNPGLAREHYKALVLGILEHDDRHLLTAHCAPESSPVEQYPDGLNLNNTYTYDIVHRKLLADYRRTPTIPFFLMESTYEGEHNSSPAQIRRQAYWAVLCGACGQLFGNNPIWLFGSGWPSALDSPGSVSMAHLRRLMLSRPWHQLAPDHNGATTFVPDLSHTVIPGGRGELRGLDYLAAARAADGSTVIAYMPGRRTITVNMAKIAGTKANAWWFDPRTGAPQLIGQLVTEGMVILTPPSDDDWVLVLDDASRNYPAPGA